MCNRACIEFGQTYLKKEEVRGKTVIEVDSYDVNGSLRSYVENLNPHSYIGVDIIKGPGVDEVCDINNLITHYGRDTFDIVISTELIEHVRDWRKAVSNLKNILKSNEVIILTTRSAGYDYHGYPFDFWRYETEDIQVMFSDLSIDAIERDPLSPDVFVKAHKPMTFIEHNLSDYDLYSIIRGKRCPNLSELDILFSQLRRMLRLLLSHLLPTTAKTYIKKTFLT